MRIGIDCRKVADFGIGSYIRGLTHALVALPASETFVLFAPSRLHALLPDTPETELVDSRAPHYSARELIALGAASRKLKLDLLHAPHYVVPFTRVPLVVTIHDLIHLRLPAARWMDRSYAKWMIGRAVKQSRQILTVSGTVKKEISERYPGAEERIVVTPNGIDPIFRSDRTAEDLPHLASMELSPDGYFMFAGNRKPHKNVGRLLTAWNAVRARRPDLRLVLAGGDWSDAELPPGVAAIGFIPIGELAVLYRNALGLVQPSIEEGFGLPLVEAMASGTPVICSNIGTLTEVAGGTCFLVDPFDHGTISSAMIRLAEDPEQRASLRAAGRLRAAHFTWERCAIETLRAYRAAAHMRQIP